MHTAAQGQGSKEALIKGDEEDADMNVKELEHSDEVYDNIGDRKDHDITNFIKEHVPLHESNLSPCHGTIVFTEIAKSSTSKFIRFSPEASPQKLYQLMKEHWEMEPPSFVISITGGAKSFNVSPRLQNAFRAGIRKVASTPGTWLISGGTNTGVMKMVGDATRGTKSTVVGIATWGILANKDSLVPTDGHPKNPGNTDTEIVAETDEEGLEMIGTEDGIGRLAGGTFEYQLGSYLVLENSLSHLNQHHSHFLLLDDGTEKKFGVEINFRAEFESFLMTKACQIGKRIPTVLFVFEGGPNTLEQVLQAVRNEVPCVVVKGSGRAADLIAYGVDSMDRILENGEESTEDLMVSSTGTSQLNRKKMERKKKKKVDLEVKEEIRALKLGNSDESISKCQKNLIECLRRHQKNHSITILDHEKGMDTESAILSAILSNTRCATPDYEKLRLTLLWDRVDLAENVILSPMHQWKNSDGQKKNDTELLSLMIISLAMNNVPFVKLLSDYGISIKKVITPETLEFLYAYRRYPTSILEWSDDEVKDIKKERTLSVYDELQSLSEQAHGRKPQKIELSAVKRKLFDILSSIPNTEMEDIVEIPDDGRSFKYPYKQIFLWAVLNNMLDMALYILEFVEDDLAELLLASALTSGLKELVKDKVEEEVEEKLQSSMQTYSRLSIELMDEMHKIDEQKTQLHIRKELDIFNNEYSCIDFAFSTGQEDFVAHRAVQKILDGAWRGSLQEEYRGLRVFAAIFFPFLLWWMNISNKDTKCLRELKTRDKKKTLSMRTTKYESITASQSNCNQSNGCCYGNQCWKTKFFYFHTESPMVRFQVHAIGYFLFLVLFSYIAIQKPESKTPTELEWLLIVTVIGYAANEIHQLIAVDARSKRDKTKQYLSSFWNQVDLVALILFLLAIALRFSGFRHARDIGNLCYAIDLSIWIVRVMQYFNDDPVCGPYVHMILKMFRDMIKFLFILFVFLLSYGIATRAILEEYAAGGERVISSFFKPFMAIFGEYFIDERTNTTTLFGTDLHNNYAESLAFIYLVVYLLIANVLLLNLLIAIFNNTFAEVMANASRTWKFNRYALILEYAQQRTFLFPPLSLLFHLCFLIHRSLSLIPCVRKFIEDKRSKRIDLFCDVVHHPSIFWKLQRAHKNHGLRVKMKRDDTMNMDVMALESDCMLKVLQRRRNKNENEAVINGFENGCVIPSDLLGGKIDDQKKELESLDTKINNVLEKANKILERIERQTDHQDDDDKSDQTPDAL